MKKRIIYGLLAGLFFGMYWLTWSGAVLFAFIVATYLFTYLIITRLRHHSASFLGVLGVISAGWIMLLLLTGKILPRVFLEATAITTMELEPLTSPVAVLNLGFIIFLIPVALGLLIYQSTKHGEPLSILLLAWSLLMLAAMLAYRRYAYYFAINASLLTGCFVWYVWQRLKEKSTVFAILITALLLIVMIAPNAERAVAMGKRDYLMLSDAWCETLDWVEGNTPKESIILSWWDYGYWITRIAQRKAYVNPSQKEELVTSTAQMFLAGEGVEADYIILDYHTVTGKFWAIAIWAGKQPSEFSGTYYIVEEGKATPVRLFYPEYYQSLAVRLYNFSGKAVMPTQSTVISFNASTRILQGVDTYATYEEAVDHVELGQRLVGTSQFKSPIPLEAVGGYTLVYESGQKINGIPEVKVFSNAR